jgi:LacI family transcriptional regulator
MPELTLEDIAKQVGVSRATVSRVVNGFPNITPEVRTKVLEAIQETGYHPNAAARSLASQRSGVIGLMLPRSVSTFFIDPFFPQLTQGIAYGCNKNDLTLSLYLVSNKEDEEKIYPRISRRGLLDGILVQAGQPDARMMEYLATSRVPNVILGRPFAPEGANYIDVDNVSAANTATRHLIKLGHKRVATITGERDSAVTIDRLEGYKQAMKSAGFKIDESLIVEGDFTEPGGYSAMQRLLEAKPDAVFAASDIMAVGAMNAVLAAGLRIPEDIAFVGFDDVPIATMTKVKLTTIRQPILQFGIKAVELLIDVINNGKKPARRITLETELVIRESCGAQRAAA